MRQTHYGTICLHISVPRLKLHTEYKHTALSSVKVSFDQGFTKRGCIKDENGKFCIFWTMDERECQLVYQSVQSEAEEFENSLVLLEIFTHKESLIKKIYLKADILCSLKQGLMFVSRGCDLDEIYVGKIEANEETINVCVSFTLPQKSVDIQIEKLIPLTMIENRINKLLVVCAIEGENDKLAMIWPEKAGTNVLEMLEVKYPSTEFANALIVDLQIDQDGNIMYVLKNEDGKSCCACTRYFMPLKEVEEID